MIRVTQTYLNNLTIKYFTQEGWSLLYADLPGGRRSGVGQVAQINKLWEGIYNLSPDILLIKGSEILLIEVDTAYTEEYEGKFLKYKSKEAELVKGLEAILGVKIDTLRFGFVSKGKKKPASVPAGLRPFRFLNYEDEQLKEIIIAS